jgi:hypothetical protein
MLEFPKTEWAPTAPEYFSAAAPDGSTLHGSGHIRRFAESPRVYGATCAALCVRDWLRRVGSGALSPEAVALLASLEPTAAMNFGSAVEHFAFPASGEPMPDVSRAVQRRAMIRARQIRTHPEAGRWITAEGAVYQVAHRWEDPASGLWLRMRLDCVYHTASGPGELDLKVWSGCTGRNLRFKLRDHGADLQGVLYRRGQLDLWGVTLPRTLVVAGPGITDKIFVRKLSNATPGSPLSKADDRLSRLLDRLALSYQTCTFTDPEELPKEVA